ncbi:hypothetical protein JCM13664_02380 [Methylothermus subterraneus]
MPVAAEIVGGVFTYTVKKDDTLLGIGARFGVDAKLLARENGIGKDGLIYVGQKLKIDNRHLVPARRQDGILINIPQRMLYLFRDGKLVAHYPVGLGRPSWPTPTGRFAIANKAINKDWVVPKSIQEEMRREGRVVRTRVPPGPDNPLGKYWIGLTASGYGIHSTIYPMSIYQFRSHGCIRLHPDDAEALFQQVKVGDSVEIIYRPVIVERDPEGRVWLEAHRDVYNRGVDPWQAFLQAAYRLEPLPKFIWDRVLLGLKHSEGIARRIDSFEPDKKEEEANESTSVFQAWIGRGSCFDCCSRVGAGACAQLDARQPAHRRIFAHRVLV